MSIFRKIYGLLTERLGSIAEADEEKVSIGRNGLAQLGSLVNIGSTVEQHMNEAGRELATLGVVARKMQDTLEGIETCLGKLLLLHGSDYDRAIIKTEQIREKLVEIASRLESIEGTMPITSQLEPLNDIKAELEKNTTYVRSIQQGTWSSNDQFKGIASYFRDAEPSDKADTARERRQNPGFEERIQEIKRRLAGLETPEMKEAEEAMKEEVEARSGEDAPGEEPQPQVAEPSGKEERNLFNQNIRDRWTEEEVDELRGLYADEMEKQKARGIDRLGYGACERIASALQDMGFQRRTAKAIARQIDALKPEKKEKAVGWSKEECDALWGLYTAEMRPNGRVKRGGLERIASALQDMGFRRRTAKAIESKIGELREEKKG